MNIYLGETFDSFIRGMVEGGRYRNASEVVREALRLQMREEREREAKIEVLRREIDEGRKSGSAGPFDAEEIIAMARALRAERTN